MNKKSFQIDKISDTAFWVSFYRAKESCRSDALFCDSLAALLTGERGAQIANQMKDTKYVAWTVVIRTFVIDEIISSLIHKGVDTILNLGAGLDTRPYRLNLPEFLTWIEVDQPSLIEFKDEKLKNEKSKCKLERIGLDLGSTKDRQTLFNEINGRSSKVLVLTEGVIPYLREDQVDSLCIDLRRNSRFRYWIAEYHSKDMYKHLGNKRKKREMGNTPFQFFPKNWNGFFDERGWQENKTIYLAEKAKLLGRDFPMPWWGKLLHSILPKSELDKFNKMSGFMLLESNNFFNKI